MAGNSFGEVFRITTFGESHGKAIGVVIDGCPPGLEIDVDYIQNQLDLRRPGKSDISSTRNEHDKVEVISGIFRRKSLGSPITMMINNKDQKQKDYESLENAFRPSHADFTYQMKYGFRDHRGGGRSSARETAARVAAGAIAKLILMKESIEIDAYVEQVGKIKITQDQSGLNLHQKINNKVLCPDEKVAEQMIELIRKVREEGDSIGGIIRCIVKNCPIGLGEPVFDKLEADLAKAMLSINASKGFEFGSGFQCAEMLGSEHNDLFKIDAKKIIGTRTNNAGGILGGISNGQEIYFRVAFKPVASIIKGNEIVNQEGKKIQVDNEKMRHDPCVVPRAVPVVEAMTAIVIVDHLLRNRVIQKESQLK